MLDVRMPGLSGLDLQKRMAETGTDLPIIFLTGHGDIPMSVRAMKAGAVEFLTKPVRDQDLLDAIQQALERDRAMRHQRTDTEHLRERFDLLTAKEREVMGKVAARAAQQTNCGRVGHERDHSQNSPPPGDGEDASRFPCRVSQNG